MIETRGWWRRAAFRGVGDSTAGMMNEKYQSGGDPVLGHRFLPRAAWLSYTWQLQGEGAQLCLYKRTQDQLMG